MAIIEAHGISKRFRIPSVRRDTFREHVLDFFRSRPSETLTVVDSVSFEVQRGETIGIMGRNGCGKSTLLKIVSGIYQPDDGRLIARAPITPILELGVGWNPELDAIDNICLLGVGDGHVAAGDSRGRGRDPGLRRTRTVRQPQAPALLERHGVAARLLGRLQGRARSAGAGRDFRGRRRGLQGPLRGALSRH